MAPTTFSGALRLSGSGDQGFEINGSETIGSSATGSPAVAEGVQLIGPGQPSSCATRSSAPRTGAWRCAAWWADRSYVITDNLIVDGVDGIALLESSNGNRISRNTI